MTPVDVHIQAWCRTLIDLISWAGAWVCYQGVTGQQELPAEGGSWWQKGRSSSLGWQRDPLRSIMPQKMPIVWDRTILWENVGFDEFQLLKNIGRKCFENCLTFSKWQSFNVFRSKCCFILIASINWRLKKNVGTEMEFLKMNRNKMFSSSFPPPAFLFLEKLWDFFDFLVSLSRDI